MRILLLTFLFILTAGTARADCTSDCQSSTSCDGSSWDCSRELSECYSRCNTSSSQSQFGKYPYGAIAYDETNGAWGASDRSADEESAEKSALAFCSENGRKCRIVESFSWECMAIAENKSGSLATWELDAVKEDAANAALEECITKDKAHDCHVAHSLCYGP